MIEVLSRQLFGSLEFIAEDCIDATGAMLDRIEKLFVVVLFVCRAVLEISTLSKEALKLMVGNLRTSHNSSTIVVY